MHFFTVPSTIQWLIPSCTWRKEGQGKVIYLTFDDGPNPEITAWVMDELKKHQIKATFFCVGDNLKKFPEVAKKLLTEGHQIGNHTMHHIKGWKHKNVDYLKDIENCETEIRKIHKYLNDEQNRLVNKNDTTSQSIPTPDPRMLTSSSPKLFRPPYGQIKPSQIKRLRTKGYEIIQWSNLSCDYDKRLNCEKSLSALVKNAKPGSIVVFHDSEKAENQLKKILPRYLKALLADGYTFQTLSLQ
ncbi:MAG: polysaccharide deacetylase family protein [Bacteroidetes bacterium]|nr:polysaccharide deacetylase family protein [Bacteroidota bacterium]MDA1224273.1 polysaccharide deacetylase family protein [Bacteroidota bacterium]